MTIKHPRICYICGTQSTSFEHAPAKCFFPEDPLLRKQLITVPSCTAHNEGTSPDDEYVRNTIVTNYTNNAIAVGQFETKVTRAIKLNTNSIAMGQTAQTPRGTVGTFRVDRERFDRVIKKIAYALFFNKFGKPWNKKLIVLSKNLVRGDLSQVDNGNFFQNIESFIQTLEYEGANPQVFRYSVRKMGVTDDDIVAVMVFYEGFTCLVTTIKDSTGFSL